MEAFTNHASFLSPARVTEKNMFYNILLQKVTWHLSWKTRLRSFSIALCFSIKFSRILKILKGGMVIPLIIPNVP